MYEYTVTAVCQATVTETWKVRSPRELTPEEQAEILTVAHDIEGATVDCTEETVSDEEDREIETIEHNGEVYTPQW